MTEQTSAVPAPGERRKRAIGRVISDKRRKTITVEVRRISRHPLYGKYLYRSTLLHAHDERQEAKLGDRVEVESTRPLSRLKRWRLVKIVERASEAAPIELKEVEPPGAKQALPAAASAPPADNPSGGGPVNENRQP
jgi:small subunit ribosomal protein S17